MEALLLLATNFAIVVVCYWGIQNEARKPGEPVKGLLSYTEHPAVGNPAPKAQRHLRRR
jgi:hypothetical protein